MANTDKLEIIISKAQKIFNKKFTFEVRDLANEQGLEAVRKLLRQNGIQNSEAEDQYLKYLDKIEFILNNEHNDPISTGNLIKNGEL